MPAYEYICSKCDKTFVDVKPLDEYDQMSKCPKCKSSENVKKTWKPVPIAFHGTGFTRTYIGKNK